MSDLQGLLIEAVSIGIAFEVRGHTLHLEGTQPYPADVMAAIRRCKDEVVEFLTERDVVSRAQGWAGKDIKRWSRVLNVLKKDWQPWEGSPRGTLVIWASAHHRLAEAERGRGKLLSVKGILKKRERDTLHGREADISFYSRMAKGIYCKAVVSAQMDPAAGQCMERLLSQEER